MHLTVFLQDLGAACGSKRPTCMVMVKSNSEYSELFDEVQTEVSRVKTWVQETELLVNSI